MNRTIDRQLRRLEERMHIDAGPWCPECQYGQQVIVLRGDAPEPICETCGRPKARGEGIRIIRIACDEEGPQ